MKPLPQPEPLTDDELDRLSDFLSSCKRGNAMNLEELDGFFSALIAGPDLVMPSEYHPEVFGGEMSEAVEFNSLDEANEIFGLLMRHWNMIVATLYNGEIHAPLIFEDENGELLGNDWAHGFMRGMHMRHDGWAELVNDEENGGCLLAMMLLDSEHDEDPEMRPDDPITPEKREQAMALMAAGLMNAYEYFREGRESDFGADVSQSRRSTPKIGRNDPCPCGSGKKYKHCHGRYA